MKYYPGFAQLFDNFFNDGLTSQSTILKTDIKEKDGMYELNMEVAGFKKEDIQIELNQGYLKITASRTQEKEEMRNMFVPNVMLVLVLVASMLGMAINKKISKPALIMVN